MSYRLDVTRDARGEIKALPGYVRAQARKLIQALGFDPRPPRAKELRGKPNVYRIWLAGRWRIAYAIHDEDRSTRGGGVVHVLRVFRKELIEYESLVGPSYIHEEGPPPEPVMLPSRPPRSPTPPKP